MSKPTFQLSLVKIPVTDFARSCAWYREVLGLGEDFAVDEFGWAQYDVGSVPLCLYQVGMGGGDGLPGGDTGLHLTVEDAGELHAALQQRGAQLPGGLETSADGLTFFLVSDPDGNSIKILQRTA